MTASIYFILAPVIIYLINNIISANNLLPSLSGEKHQLFVEKKIIPLSGGIFILISLLFIFKDEFNINFLYFFLIFLLGFFSDIRLIKSPRFRFLLQVLFVSIFVLFFRMDAYIPTLNITNVRIFFLDYFLKYEIFSYLFVIFCLLIVINGSNFIDGLNGLTLGYYFVLTIVAYDISPDGFKNKFSLVIEDHQLLLLLITLFFLLIFNFFNKLYIGESGSYLLGITTGTFVILLYKNTINISPLFIVLMLWYPCFENLFSIIRKRRLNLSPLKSDNKHFHHLLFYFLKKKLEFSNLKTNNISSILINLFNFIVIYIGSKNLFSSEVQVSLLIFCIFTYTIIYSRLFDFRFIRK